MGKSPRNSFVEFLRFIFSILVVGYHVQESTQPDETSFFQNGCLSVEFFFILSGYFMAKSIEKVGKKENANVLWETYKFMKNKLKGLVRLHIIINSIMLLVLLIWDRDSVGHKLWEGIPGLFFVQNIIIWQDSYELVKPEWYLSAMLLCMLIIFPCGVLLRRKLHQVLVSLILLGGLVVVIIIYGLIAHWAFAWNFQGDLRAFAEMSFTIIALFLSTKLTPAQLGGPLRVVLVVAEVLLYAVPVILGFVPIPESLQGVCIGVTVVFSFFAVIISFSGKGFQVSGRVDEIFSYLGSLSLPIYLYHPPLVYMLEYVGDLSMGATFPIVFFGSLLLSILDHHLHPLLMSGLKKLDEKEKEEIQQTKKENINVTTTPTYGSMSDQITSTPENPTPADTVTEST